MSHISRGKEFENQIKKAFKQVPDTSIHRLIDPQNGYCGVRNPCDFIAYHYPHQYFIECKSCYGNTLPFSNITDTQWQSLLEVSDVTGVIAGYMIWFIDHDVTAFVPAEYMQRLKDSGAKSLNVKKIEPEWYLIPGTKRKVLFDYDLSGFLGE